MIADAWHHRSDAIASAIIVLGALLGSKVWWVDAVLGLAVALLILHAAWDVIKDAAQRLMGAAPDAGFDARVREVVATVAPAGCDPHHLHLHDYAGHRELTLHLYLDSAMTVAEAHAISARVEAALAREMRVDATVHVDPAEQAR
ncbi:MAG: cation transporter dimerization domain-containing protein [Pseudomonadota bacterium]